MHDSIRSGLDQLVMIRSTDDGAFKNKRMFEQRIFDFDLVEPDDGSTLERQIRHDEPDAREQLAGVATPRFGCD